MSNGCWNEYEAALFFREEEGMQCVYLRSHYEAERLIEDKLQNLMQRADIALKIPVTDEHWR